MGSWQSLRKSRVSAAIRPLLGRSRRILFRSETQSFTASATTVCSCKTLQVMWKSGRWGHTGWGRRSYLAGLMPIYCCSFCLDLNERSRRWQCK
ncbi:ATP phosphoribosyltransferase 2 [Pyrus ussuriensis x Pyrus communis]|uniref:ATP phosphoribosyltransferase 2 n=1 Tax=Pyrus ussuriensis x Pyrus communis TaxID=2448454 RepID=A0A5N5FNC6_9ROSA|nr:ATP phosphoribosyltransferase 2 [Pyrus ussuriensis x Pyrus communis]